MKFANGVGLRCLLAVIFVTIVLAVVTRRCPEQGLALRADIREFHRLKNRTSVPQPADFDSAVTLSGILQPGGDQSRWSTSRAARVEGYVVAVGKGGVELTNCYLPWNRDTHINLALKPNAPPREQVVLEITPRLEAWAKGQARDWSEETLRRELPGHWCRFEGWLFYDSNHVEEAENTAPHGPHNWRATAWEIHPVTNLAIVR